MPEAVVLQSVLRSASGFIAAPRRPGGPQGPSQIEQILIVAVSRGNASAVITMPTVLAPQPVSLQGSPDDDIPPVQRMGPQPAQPGPQPNAPSPQPSAQPTAPMTSPTPGTVLLPPVKPGTPVTPGTIIKSPTT
jgi:biotin carboxyl carrier protein